MRHLVTCQGFDFRKLNFICHSKSYSQSKGLFHSIIPIFDLMNLKFEI